MKTLKSAISESLQFDPLGAAERVTGKSYKECEGTSSLGMLMALEHYANKDALLSLAGDTHFRMSWPELKELLAKRDFVTHYTHHFKSPEGTPDEAIVCFNEKMGALLWAESYAGTSINGGSVYFNWEYPEGGDWNCSGASHGQTKKERVRYVSYDIREGLFHHLQEAADNGKFVTPWVHRPFLWLLTHWDTKVEGYSYDAINAERLSHLPASILKAISP